MYYSVLGIFLIKRCQLSISQYVCLLKKWPIFFALTMTGRGVDALLAFFFVCGVPGTFSACALDITLTGLQKRPVWRLHLISHTIMLPSLAPVAKITDKETRPIQFVHYHVTEKLFSTFEAYLS